MNNYSIVRIGNAYIVRAGDKSVLKLASRRRAAKLVTDAAELLDAGTVSPLAPEAPAVSSIACDGQDMADPGVIPDPCEVP